MVKINSLIINNHKIIIMDKEINILIIISNFKIMIDRKIIIGIINNIINNFNNILIKIIPNNINLLNINKSYYRK